MPIGGNLVVHTRGSGVGQLHVQLGYNVPTDEDELCRFDMKIECTDIKFKMAEKDKYVVLIYSNIQFYSFLPNSFLLPFFFT